MIQNYFDETMHLTPSSKKLVHVNITSERLLACVNVTGKFKNQFLLCKDNFGQETKILTP